MFGPFSLVDVMVMWLILIGLGVVAVAVAVIALVVMNRASEFRPSQVGFDEGERFALAGVARRRVLMCVVGVVAVTLIARLCGGVLRYGLNLALLPVVASCIAAGLAAMPYDNGIAENGSGGAGGVRVASLRSREPWTYARWYVLAQPIVVSVMLIGYLTITACMGTTDGDGAGRSIRLTKENAYGGVVGESGPFPGVYYALPLIAVTVLLVVLVCAALLRISRTPAAAGGGGGWADRMWRSTMTKFVVFLSSGSMLVCAAGVLYFAGGATRRVGTNFDTLPPTYADDVYPTLGLLQMAVSGVMGVLALVYLAMAVFAAARLWIGMWKADAR
ncbi:hypothetical protein CSQ85_00515 [Bifidobacterium rousetti]|uniref:hypothetical protein n=1 Tax=Bifidobacterium rousetti TaxID=2045439 RepID=UPI00168B0320|nr:hypothetical protein [Bifidobacterium rousetti]KAA8820325.1 hypothetical protein CSQ85_00515 [Bifidobacterium rousetti]